MSLVRKSTLLGLSAIVVLALSGCSLIKPGSVVLNQPAGVGPAHLHLDFCTIKVDESEPEPKVLCGPSEETTEAQLMFGIVAPVGTSIPQTLSAVPGNGGPALTFTRNAELAQSMSELEYTEGVKGLPPGTEISAYVSGVYGEQEGVELTHSLDLELGLPKAADGGSYGGPLKLALPYGWRQVAPASPSSRPVKCSDPEPATTAICFLQPTEAGVSDLKIAAGTIRMTPKETRRISFNFDFASSASPFPSFKLSASSTLAGLGLTLPTATFNRKPTDPTTKRAPSTVRKVVAKVPATARPGQYPVTMTATTATGGSVAASAQLVITPRGRPQLLTPKKVTTAKATRGVPVLLVMPSAGARAVVRLFAPRPSGRGKVLLSKRVGVATEFGPLRLKLKVRRARAAALRAAGAKLTVQARVTVPTASPAQLTRKVSFR